MFIETFPYLEQVSRESGVPPTNLIKVFELESCFHQEILLTADPELRKTQYQQLYAAIHPLIRPNEGRVASTATYGRLVKLFQRELTGKSVLDIGCGNGEFLLALEKTLPHTFLCGLDACEPRILNDSSSRIDFRVCDITSFSLPRKFDVVFSHQVLEHIAPADFDSHVDSISKALRSDGTFIALLPNKFWGPTDISAIIDNSCTGRIAAQGSHLGESSYCELVPCLENRGFRDVMTILPFALFVPLLGRVRVRPVFNQLLERHHTLRRLSYLAKFRGKPIFKNHVVLVCRKR